MKWPFPMRDLPKRALVVVVVLAAVAGVVTGREKPTVELMREKRPDPAAATVGADIDLARLERGESSLPQVDPFAPRSFGRPKAASSAAPARPAPPPLPFAYIGKVIENGKQEIYVSRGDELVSIARGQKIGTEYRVEAITDSSITFTYLPMKTKQTLDIPAVN